jgi:hypothetical protein
MRRSPFLIVGLIPITILAGCASHDGAPTLTVADPAHADAAEAPYSPPTNVLNESDAAPPSTPTEKPNTDNHAHRHEGGHE